MPLCSSTELGLARHVFGRRMPDGSARRVPHREAVLDDNADCIYPIRVFMAIRLVMDDPSCSRWTIADILHFGSLSTRSGWSLRTRMELSNYSARTSTSSIKQATQLIFKWYTFVSLRLERPAAKRVSVNDYLPYYRRSDRASTPIHVRLNIPLLVWANRIDHHRFTCLWMNIPCSRSSTCCVIGCWICLTLVIRFHYLLLCPSPFLHGQ